jgi:hypothetical protein
MREKKVRAWDEELEEWFYSDKPDDIHFFEFVNGTLRGFAIRPPRASDDPMEPPEPYCDDYDPLEFTGLHDRHGVEIYEGDIVVHYNPVLDEGYEDRMKYKTEATLFNLQVMSPERRIRLEVIGNIHEEKP